MSASPASPAPRRENSAAPDAAGLRPGAEPYSSDSAASAASAAGTSGRRVGAVVIHGFTGSVAGVRPWAEELAAAGLAVEAPLLPGHGTRWQDLNKVRWQDWADEVLAAHDRLAQSCDVVLSLGLSMGGALALYLATERRSTVRGAVVVNPFLASDDPRRMVLPALSRVVPSLAGVVNDIKRPGQDEVGYPRLPLRGLAQVFDLWRTLTPRLSSLDIPVILYRSAVDHVVDSASARLLRERLHAVLEEHELPESYHVATLDNDAPTIVAGSLDLAARVADPVGRG